MKNRIISFLLCILMLSSMFLFTACGEGKGSKTVVVENREERVEKMASFVSNLETAEKGLTATLTVKGTSKNSDGVEVSTDLTISFKSVGESFSIEMDGIADGDAGTADVYFDGRYVTYASTAENEDEDYGEYDLADLIAFISSFISSDEEAPEEAGEGEDTKETAEEATAEETDPVAEIRNLMDHILACIDVEKLVEVTGVADNSCYILYKVGSKYKIEITSDLIYDSILGILNILKDSGDKKISEVVDLIFGEGTYANVISTLKSVKGTDKVEDSLPEIEKALTDAGINVTKLYEVIGNLLLDEEATAEETRTFLIDYLDGMTFNDVIGMVVAMFGSELGLTTSQDSLFGSATKTLLDYEAIIAMIEQYADMTVNALGTTLSGSSLITLKSFKIDEEIAPAIEAITYAKEAIKFTFSTTCTKDMVPEESEFTIAIDTTKFPESYEMDPVNFNVTGSIKIGAINLEPTQAIKDAQTKIAADKAKEQTVEE